MAGPLKNAKHEAFVRFIVKGMCASEAYRKAGYTTKTANSLNVCSSKLLHDAKVQARLAELQTKVTEKVVEKVAITKEAIIAELAKIGFANMMDYISVGSNGDASVDFSRLDRDKAAAIQEVTTEHYMEGEGEDAKPMKRVKFKLLDKRAPLVDIGKHLGMFIHKIEHGGPGDFSDKTEDELLDMDERLAGELEEVIMHDGTGSVN